MNWRSALVLILVLVLPSCGGSSRQLERDFEQAQRAIRRGEYAEARQLTARALERTSDPAWSWKFRLVSAESAILVRDFDAAEKTLAEHPPDDARFDGVRARLKFLEAKLLITKGRVAPAREALAAGRQIAPPDDDVRLDIDQLDGQALMRLGQWGPADTLLHDVVARAEARSDEYHAAMALNDLGMGRVVRSRYDEALPYFERVLQRQELSDLIVYALSLSNAGSCLQRLGQFDRAMAVQQRALDVHQHRGKREDFVAELGEMGNLYVLRGDANAALPYYRRALDQAMSANLRPQAALLAGNLAYANIRLERWDEAERYNTQAEQLWNSTHPSPSVYHLLWHAMIASGRGQYDEATEALGRVLAFPSAPPSVLWGTHFDLSQIALKQNRPDRAIEHFEATLQTIEKTRAGLLKADYKVSYLSELIAFYRAYAETLIEQGRADRALEVIDSSHGRILAERQGGAQAMRLDARALRQLAQRTGTVFLSYSLSPGKSYLWVVAPGGFECIPLATTEKDVANLVRDHQAAIANVLANPLSSEGAGDKLYQLLIAPAAKWLPAGASVVVVPDGPLNGINFETLPVAGARRHYWIEDAQVAVAPSLASVVESKPAPARAASVLLIGNPQARPPEFPALANAPAEMSRIAAHFESDRVTSFDGDRASPAAYTAAKPDRFAYVHFAAHATANVESPLDSAVILSGPEGRYKLYARDVAARPLTADLVTVSACRSAGERTYSGEGLIGFSWAFLRAGARRVVAGLWDVDDKSTSDLMDRLYAGLASGQSPAAALRAAKLALIKEGGALASPYRWGPFELFTTTI